MIFSAPVLAAPDFKKHFKVQVNATDIDVGAVLLQERERGIDHPVSFLTGKFIQIIPLLRKRQLH